ncbi:MAG: DUF2207 domain-containing protein [Lachnospiraceae bacterium]|nr:DUF2207 domain-containing protein [Lachnospiraceae bacterium]
MDWGGKEMLVYLVSGIMIITAILPAIWWLLYGRDKEIVETVEFYPPDDMTPAEIAYALDEYLDDEELMYMVFYLADKGVIGIEPEDTHFVLKFLKKAEAEEPDYVETFLEWLFPGREREYRTNRSPFMSMEPVGKMRDQVREAYEGKYGDVYSLKSDKKRWACVTLMDINLWLICPLSVGFRESYMAIGAMMFISLTVFAAWGGFDNYRLNKKKGIIQILSGTLLTVGGLGSWGAMMNTLSSSVHIYVFWIVEVIIFFFSMIMHRRSDKSREIMGRLYGFRTFIKEAEYDKIQKLVDEDPNYFFRILPYAAVLGLETNWSKHFSGIACGGGKWYWSEKEEIKTHDSQWYGDMMRSCAKSMVPKKTT